MNTIKPTTATDIARKMTMKTVEIAPVRPNSRVEARACGRLADDAGEDDQRDPIADAARGDLLAEPHQKDSAAGERHHRHQRKNNPGSTTAGLGARAHAFEPDGDAVGLDGGQQDCAETCCIGSAFCARSRLLFFSVFKGRRNRGQ